MSAVLERFDGPQVLAGGGHPVVLADRRVVLECGCSVYIGMRIDTMEAATVASYCVRAHEPLCVRFYKLLAESLEEPTDRMLHDVVIELLDQAVEEVPV